MAWEPGRLKDCKFCEEPVPLSNHHIISLGTESASLQITKPLVTVVSSYHRSGVQPHETGFKQVLNWFSNRF